MNQLELAARRTLKEALALVDSGHRIAGPRLLIYHQVGSNLRREMEVTLPAFRAQMEYLQDSFDVVTLQDALERSDDCVVITIDDGYKDTFTTAFPILDELRLPFTLYLATESIETGRSLGPGAGAEPLTWEQIESMAASDLVTIGSHTHTHVDLRNATESSALREFDISDELIWRRLGTESKHFAYPWGYWGEGAHAAAVGRYASAVLGGGVETGPANHMKWNRIPIQLSDTSHSFRSKIRHGGRAEEVLRRKLRGYSGP